MSRRSEKDLVGVIPVEAVQNGGMSHQVKKKKKPIFKSQKAPGLLLHLNVIIQE
jgi:hypothetical protein